MTECHRKKQLLGKSIRKIRMRRNMTQRAVSKATDGISESALRSYELGERSPKQNALERIAKEGKPIKGFYYYYAGEMLPDEYRQKIRNQKKKPNYKSRPVICLETGERFESISLVSRMLGISKSNVFHAMKNGSAVHGIHFYYGDELKPDDSFFKPKRRRKVRCTETGVVYESIKDAAERTKISPNGIGSAASGMAGGYHWEYADD